jgi:predicted O-methyltransferase YrrM
MPDSGARRLLKRAAWTRRGGTIAGVDDRVAVVLDELHRHGVEHDAGRADRLEQLRNVEPDTAGLLALLVRATGARRLLEIGTSNGWSTVWPADALRSTGGRMLTVDTDAERSAQAARNLERAGLTGQVELRGRSPHTPRLDAHPPSTRGVGCARGCEGLAAECDPSRAAAAVG